MHKQPSAVSQHGRCRALESSKTPSARCTASVEFMVPVLGRRRGATSPCFAARCVAESSLVCQMRCRFEELRVRMRRAYVQQGRDPHWCLVYIDNQGLLSDRVGERGTTELGKAA